MNTEAKSSDAPFCFLTHGGIASGKTSVKDSIFTVKSFQEKYLYIRLDRVKEFLPEYVFMRKQKIKEAAIFTQWESAKISGRTFKKAIAKRLHIIHEGSLKDLVIVKEQLKKMQQRNYGIAVIATHVKEEIAYERAEKRYKESGRYVPSEVIVESYKKCPRTLVELRPLVDSIILFDNNLERAIPMLIVARKKTVHILDKLYAEYISRVGPEGDLLDAKR